MDNPLSKGSLEGRKLRAVVVLVGIARNIQLDFELTQFNDCLVVSLNCLVVSLLS